MEEMEKSGIICDRKLQARVKGKVYSSVVRPAMEYGLETVAVTKKQVEEMEIVEMKMLRFAMGVTRKDKIKNKYIRGTVRNEHDGGQTEVIWTCYEERPGVCRKKDDGSGVAGKEKKREANEKIFRCSEKRYGKVGAKEEAKDTLEKHDTLWLPLIERKS